MSLSAWHPLVPRCTSDKNRARNLRITGPLLLSCFIKGKNNENPSQNNDIEHKQYDLGKRGCWFPVAYDAHCHKTVSQLSHSNALIPIEALCRRIDARGSGMELLGHLVLIGGCI